MVQMTIVATGVAVCALSLGLSVSDAAARKTATKVSASPPPVEHVQDCSVFYEPYSSRGFGWGSGPDSNVGFGTFEGALPAYPMNSFPNWYGTCVTAGHFSASGSAR